MLSFGDTLPLASKFNFYGQFMIKLFYAILLAWFSAPAWAYLDPGTGSMILQGLIAGLAVASLTIKTYWYKLRGLFGKKNPSSLLEEEEVERAEEDQ